MANIFLETVTYLTETELKDSTRVDDVALSGTDVNPSTVYADNRKILIRKSEIVIDSVIWSYGTKLVSTQGTIFPTVADWVPIAIKKAVVLLCEGMFLGWELEQSSSYSGAKIVKAEWHGEDKIEFQNEAVNTGGLSRKNPYISQEIEMLLKPYITTTSNVRWSKSA